MDGCGQLFGRDGYYRCDGYEAEQSVIYDSLPGFVSKFRVNRNLDFKLLEANDRFFDFLKDSMDGMDTFLFREKYNDATCLVFLEHKKCCYQ